jgi:DnaJ-class molecular chaperone
MSKDPYEALGLKKTATADEIKKAYRKIARTSHPDLNPDDPAAEARFKAASAAYDLLKDPETRAKFDRGEIDATGAERQDRQFYREYAGSPENPYWQSRSYGDAGDFSDIFEDLFRRSGANAGRGAGQGMRMRGGDMRYTLEVGFLDAVRGAKTRITMPEGGVLEVQIPRGTADGQTIRLRGKGGPGYGGGEPGDALVTVTVRPHPLFRRDGDDIVITLPITLDEAILGGKVEAPTIGGPVHLTIPKGASGGQVLRLRGRGVHRQGKKAAGDQRVELRIVTPDKIDDALVSFMETWRKKHAYNPRKGIKV